MYAPLGVFLYKINLRHYYYYSLLCINVVHILWRPADSNECCFGYHCRWRASDCCNLQRGSTNKLYSPLFYWFCKNPLTSASSNPLQRGSQGWGTLIHQNHAAGGENSFIMVGMFVSMCLASQKPSEREFFVPARTDSGVKLLSDHEAR